MTVASQPYVQIDRPIAAVRPRVGVPWYYALIAALFVLIGLQALYWTGPVGSDDLAYYGAACEPDPHAPGFTPIPHVYGRVMMWLPLRLILGLFGHAWGVLMVWPMMSATVTLGLLGVVVKRWSGPAAALIAMLSAGLVPVMVNAATIMLPDIVGAMFMMIGVAMCLGAFIHEQRPSALRRCLLAGFVIGIGYSAKEVVVLLIPAVGLFVLIARRHHRWAWSRWGALCAGGLAWLAVEMIFLGILTGDPLYHTHAITQTCRSYGTPLADDSAWGFFLFVTDYIRWLANPRGEFAWWGPIYLLALLFSGWCVLAKPKDERESTDRDRRLLLLCVCFVAGVYLSIGTVDLTAYFPGHHQTRYLLPLVPLIAWMVSDLFTAVWQKVPRLRGLWVIAALLLVAGSMLWPNRQAGKIYYASLFHTARSVLNQPDAPWSRQATVRASGHGAFRTRLLRSDDGAPRVAALAESPLTPQAWQRVCAGAYVMVTNQDRNQSSPSPGYYLGHTSYEALRLFPRVAVKHAPLSRLDTVLTSIGMRDDDTKSSLFVEVFHVTDPDDLQTKASRLNSR